MAGMYLPPGFRVDDEATLREFVARHAFGLLVTSGDDGVLATSCPMIWRERDGPHGEVWGHVARANPQWRHFDQGGEALLVFQGPHAYISPRYYATEVNVPTWNYTAVQLRGAVSAVHEPPEMAELLTVLTRAFEDGADDPWAFDPEHPKLALLLRAVVGFRVRVKRVDGKFKLNQNKAEADRAAVVERLGASPSAEERRVAELMELLEPDEE